MRTNTVCRASSGTAACAAPFPYISLGWLPALLLVLLAALAACARDGNEESESPPPAVVIQMEDSTFATLLTGEQGSEDSFQVRLKSEPAGAATVFITGLDPTEVTVDPPELTFTSADWGFLQTITVTGLDDEEIDGNQAFSIVLQTSASAFVSGRGPGVAVSAVNVDDDTPGVTVIGGLTSFAEAGGVGSFAVVLNAPPDGDVVVDVTCTDPSEALLGDGAGPEGESVSLYFSITDWSSPQRVYLFGQDDDQMDGDQVFDLNVAVNAAATSDTTGYLSLAPSPVTVTVQDDETANVIVMVARACGS